jgi:hypothetical protein
MAQFRATPEDFDEVIKNQQRQSLRRQGPYPIGALLAGMLLSFIHKPTAFIAFGMAIAWSVSIILDVRNLKMAYLWRFAWAQEEAVVDIDDEGVRLTTARGSGFIRWKGGVIVRLCSTCFVVEEEGEEIAVLPKRYLDSQELLMLQTRALAVGAQAPAGT